MPVEDDFRFEIDDIQETVQPESAPHTVPIKIQTGPSKIAQKPYLNKQRATNPEPPAARIAHHPPGDRHPKAPAHQEKPVLFDRSLMRTAAPKEPECSVMLGNICLDNYTAPNVTISAYLD